MKLLNGNKIYDNQLHYTLIVNLLHEICYNRPDISICNFCGTIYIDNEPDRCPLCDNSVIITDSPGFIKSEIVTIFKRKGINIDKITWSGLKCAHKTINFHISRNDIKYLKAVNILPDNSYIIKSCLIFVVDEISYFSFVQILKSIIKWSKFIPNDRINLQKRCAQCKFWKCIEYQKSRVIQDGYCRKNLKYSKNIQSVCENFKK